MKVKSIIMVMSIALLSVGCGNDSATSAQPCTSTTEDDGSVTIDCGSGGTSTIAAPDAGAPILVSTADASAEDCANGDDVLDEDEITETITTCNGEGGTGTDGSNTLMDLTDEPAGENCAAGGQRMDYGVDTNQDGVLDDDEIDGTQYVCDGEQGETGTGLTALV